MDTYFESSNYHFKLTVEWQALPAAKHIHPLLLADRASSLSVALTELIQKLRSQLPLQLAVAV